MLFRFTRFYLFLIKRRLNLIKETVINSAGNDILSLPEPILIIYAFLKNFFLLHLNVIILERSKSFSNPVMFLNGAFHRFNILTNALEHTIAVPVQAHKRDFTGTSWLLSASLKSVIFNANLL